MVQWNKLQVVMLPTEDSKTLVWLSQDKPLLSNWRGKPQHIYIISDEGIKKGDWIYHFLLKGGSIIRSKYDNPNTTAKKIIATTDSSLKIESELDAYYRNGIGGAKSLPQPSQEFIQQFITAYNAGTPIKDVLVEYETKDEVYHCLHDDGSVKYSETKEIFTLKVNPDNTINIKVEVERLYTREEVIELIKRFGKEQCGAPWYKRMREWVEDNLK